MTDKINDFLKETELKDISKGTWGLGSMFTRAGAKPVLSLMSVTSATDQILIAANREVVLPIVEQALKKIGFGLKDPAVFDVPTATFAVLVAQSVWGIRGKPCLVFVTLKAVSESSTHVLLEGYTKAWGDRLASAEVKRVREEIGARFH